MSKFLGMVLSALSALQFPLYMISLSAHRPSRCEYRQKAEFRNSYLNTLYHCASGSSPSFVSTGGNTFSLELAILNHGFRPDILLGDESLPAAPFPTRSPFALRYLSTSRKNVDMSVTRKCFFFCERLLSSGGCLLDLCSSKFSGEERSRYVVADLEERDSASPPPSQVSSLLTHMKQRIRVPDRERLFRRTESQIPSGSSQSARYSEPSPTAKKQKGRDHRRYFKIYTQSVSRLPSVAHRPRVKFLKPLATSGYSPLIA